MIIIIIIMIIIIVIIMINCPHLGLDSLKNIIQSCI